MGACSNVFSIDVEDWFHILDLKSAPRVEDWAHQPSRVEKNFLKFLELLAEQNIKSTCFFLGWVAERFPHLVKLADEAGHEVASHGYNHQLIHSMAPSEFRADLLKAKSITENILGKSICGYRAPGFSITESNLWAIEILAETGFKYDSSFFPGGHGHGGITHSPLGPHRIQLSQGEILEFPISVSHIFRKPVCFFGGGYFRLFPYPVIKNQFKRVNREGRPVVFYAHPRKIDPEQPRMKMSALRHFKTYVNLSTAREKLRRLTSEFKFVSFEQWLRLNTVDTTITLEGLGGAKNASQSISR